MGLSDREAEILRAVAVGCEEERRSVDASERALTLAARLERVDGQAEYPGYKALLVKRSGIVTGAMRRLEAEFGSARFEVLLRFVLEGASRPSYFPLRPR
jgi:hypothetical protein